MSSDLTNPEALADREPELRALQDAFASAQSDVSPIVLVIGDSGTGKSFLVDTFRREMENLDPNFIAASASGEPMAGRASSFEPIREILEHLIGMTDQRGGAVGSTVDAGRLKHPRSEMLRELLRTARQPLSALLSSPSRELLEAYGIEPGIINAWLKLIQTRSTSIDDPHATLQAVAALLGACPVPLALILDDIQWIDSASLQLFLKLPRQTARHRLIFIATARTDGDAAVQLSGRSTVTDLARAVLREDRNAVIDLNAVRRSRGREFCRELLTTRGFDASDESVDNLLRVTGANALFASDLLHNLGANMDQSHRSGVPLRFGAIKWTQLPPRHSDALQHRILQLSSEASHIIETAAVEGQEFTAEVIAHIHGMDLLKVLEILEIELGRSHRLVEDMSPSATLMSHLRSAHPKLSRFTFTHGYYQHLIYTTRVGNSRRRELHGRVALAMEQLWTSGTEQIAAQLAQHFELAADSERAIPYYATAAQRGLRLADFESAAVCAESGLRLVGHAAGTVSADHLGTLYVSGTTAARVRGDFRHAETLAREGLALPATAVPDRIRMRLKSELARSLYNLDVDFAEAEAQLQEAISLAESLAELSQQADLRRQLGIAFQRQGRFIEAVGQYLKALDIVPADDPGIVVADTVNSVGVTFALLGRNDFAVTCHQSALRLAAAQGDSSRDTLFLNDGAAPLRRLGRISDVRDTVNGSARLAKEQGKIGALARATYELAQAARVESDWTEYSARLFDVLEHAAALGAQSPQLSKARGELLLLSCSRPDLSRPLNVAEEAAALGPPRVTGTSEMHSADYVRGMLALSAGDSGTALGHFERLAEAVAAMPAEPCWAWSFLRAMALLGSAVCTEALNDDALRHAAASAFREAHSRFGDPQVWRDIDFWGSVLGTVAEIDWLPGGLELVPGASVHSAPIDALQAAARTKVAQLVDDAL